MGKITNLKPLRNASRKRRNSSIIKEKLFIHNILLKNKLPKKNILL